MERCIAPQQVLTQKSCIGNGPAALILSYILHGHIPYYRGGHWDALIDRKLQPNPELLHIEPDVHNHLETSLKYSTQALPINTLLDTLLRPEGDVGACADSCIEWRHQPERARQHVVLGSAPNAGGQWADNPVSTSWEIGALSYAEQLSLPGYSFQDHWLEIRHEEMPELTRPARSDTSAYYAAYPKAVGIDGALRNSARISGVVRQYDDFFISSHNLRCKNLVLASGIFNEVIQPPLSLAPLRSLESPEGPILVVGSGFTAADIIISAPANRPIVHVFNWDPENRPSPLRACHASAYPEYAFVYRQMKLAAMNQSSRPVVSRKYSTPRKLSSLPEYSRRDWTNTYHGHSNACVHLEDDTVVRGQGSTRHAVVRIQAQSSEEKSVPLEIGSFYFAAGRRGSLTYLDPSLTNELLSSPLQSVSSSPKLGPWTESITNSHSLDKSSLPSSQAKGGPPQHMITGQTLRNRMRNNEDGSVNVEVAPEVYAIGSLTGDSLVRFAYGCCCLTAGRLMPRVEKNGEHASG